MRSGVVKCRVMKCDSKKFQATINTIKTPNPVFLKLCTMIKYIRGPGHNIHIYETQKIVAVWYREFAIYMIQNSGTLPSRATQNSTFWTPVDLNINE